MDIGIFILTFVACSAIVFAGLTVGDGSVKNTCMVFAVAFAMLSAAILGDITNERVSAEEYLKDPASYKVDTFMVNGVLDHYSVKRE